MKPLLKLFFDQNTPLGTYLTFWGMLLCFYLTWKVFGPDYWLGTATYLLLQTGLLVWAWRAAYLHGRNRKVDDEH